MRASAASTISMGKTCRQNALLPLFRLTCSAWFFRVSSITYPFVEAIAVQRTAQELYRKRIPLIPRIMTEWAHSRTGMDLHPGAQIGTHFFVDHCTGTVVGETALIGSHVKMYQGVGLVARSLSGGQLLRGQKRHPTIEDHVTIYAGATIMGGDTVVGEGSTIGANGFLTHSVPANSLVIYEDVQ